MSEVAADDRDSEAERELDQRERDTAIATRIFLFVGSAVGTMSLVYLLTEDDAGQMMLGAASLLGLMCGTYLYRNRVRGRTKVIDDGHLDPDVVPGDRTRMYLPHASIWPFWIGLAAFLVTNGLVLGVWFLVPGVVLLIVGVVGLIRQSRGHQPDRSSSPPRGEPRRQTR